MQLQSDDPDELYSIICKKDYSDVVNLGNFSKVMKTYKLDSRVLVQIEENFKVSRENAADSIYIRKVDAKGEMYYLEHRLTAGLDDADGVSPRHYQTKRLETDSKSKVNASKNRESSNTKEATFTTVVVPEDPQKTKWFFGMF